MPENVEFIWDSTKARRNVERHGVSFEEAQTAFDDPYALILEDETHSFEESRELLIGHSKRNRLLFVVFVERTIMLIRLISARLATAGERKRYEEEKRE
ncbi:MAG: hypothetical protein HDKAJFGB_02780 [Anaerolineae bacterium]|nr:hypothetical protein [Anaerolineae bacterium]